MERSKPPSGKGGSNGGWPLFFWLGLGVLFLPMLRVSVFIRERERVRKRKRKREKIIEFSRLHGLAIRR